MTKTIARKLRHAIHATRSANRAKIEPPAPGIAAALQADAAYKQTQEVLNRPPIEPRLDCASPEELAEELARRLQSDERELWIAAWTYPNGGGPELGYCITSKGRDPRPEAFVMCLERSSLEAAQRILTMREPREEIPGGQRGAVVKWIDEDEPFPSELLGNLFLAAENDGSIISPNFDRPAGRFVADPCGGNNVIFSPITCNGLEWILMKAGEMRTDAAMKINQETEAA